MEIPKGVTGLSQQHQHLLALLPDKAGCKELAMLAVDNCTALLEQVENTRKALLTLAASDMQDCDEIHEVSDHAYMTNIVGGILRCAVGQLSIMHSLMHDHSDGVGKGATHKMQIEHILDHLGMGAKYMELQREMFKFHDEMGRELRRAGDGEGALSDLPPELAEVLESLGLKVDGVQVIGLDDFLSGKDFK